MEKDPGDYRALTNLAAAAAALGDHERSFREAQRAVALDANWLKGYFRAGAAALRLGRPGDAAPLLERAAALDPDSERIRALLAEARDLLRGRPEDVAACKEAGNARFRRGEYAEAIALYSKGIGMCGPGTGELPVLLLNRAECHRQSGDYRRVVEDCTRALELDATSVKARLRRALALEASEKFNAALADFKGVIGLDPNNRLASEGMRRMHAAAAAV